MKIVGPNKMIDALTIYWPDIADQASRHLIAPLTGNVPVYTVVGPNYFWNLKTDAGNQGDRFRFGTTGTMADTVTADITESDTSPSPSAFKMFVPPIIWSLRWLPEHAYLPSNISASTAYRRYSDCETFSADESLGGPAETYLMPPMDYDFGGDLGVRPTCIHTYKYDPNYTAMELNYYAPAFVSKLTGKVVPAAGRCQWELWGQVNGIYVRNKVVTYNTWKSGGAPALAFPCNP